MRIINHQWQRVCVPLSQICIGSPLLTNNALHFIEAMLRAIVLVVLSCVLRHTAGLTLNTRKYRVSALSARKHLAVRYGDALDNLKRENKYSEKLEEVAERMDLNLDAEQEEAISGSDQRRKRIRDLKEAEATQPDNIDYLTRKEKERNWTPEEIIAAVTCLNLSYGIDPQQTQDAELDFLYDENEEGEKEEEEEEEGEEVIEHAWSEAFEAELEEKDRLEGSIDWDQFAIHANDAVIHFGRTYGESAQVRNRVQGWLEFHIRKTDIRFENNVWVWDPAGAFRRGRDKRRARHRSGDKLRPPGSKARRRRRFTRHKSRLSGK